MTFAFLDDNGDPPAEFLVSLLGDPRLAFEPRIEAAANVEEVHTRVGQRGQIIERLRFRHVAAQDGILAVDATDLVRVRDGPGVGFPSRSACAFHDRLRGKALVDQIFVNGVPLLQNRAIGVPGARAGDDVKAFVQQGQIDHCIPSDEVRPEAPRASQGLPSSAQ